MVCIKGAIRQLPRPLLEALSQGFRKRFSIPEEAATIADRIVQKRHHDWIGVSGVAPSGALSQSASAARCAAARVRGDQFTGILLVQMYGFGVALSR